MHVDKTLMSKLLKDSMKLGNTKNTLYMLLLITLDGKDHYTNIPNIIIISILDTLSSVSLNILSEEKLRPIISSFPTKFGLGSKPTENNTPTLISPSLTPTKNSSNTMMLPIDSSKTNYKKEESLYYITLT